MNPYNFHNYNRMRHVPTHNPHLAPPSRTAQNDTGCAHCNQHTAGVQQGQNPQYDVDLLQAFQLFYEQYVAAQQGGCNCQTNHIPSRGAGAGDAGVVTNGQNNSNTAEIQSRVIDNLLELYSAESRANAGLTEDQAKTLVRKLGAAIENQANQFVNNYKGDDLEGDLQTFLKDYINTSDAQRMEPSLKQFEVMTAKLEQDVYTDQNELAELKNYASQILMGAMANAIPIVIDGQELTNQAAIAAKVADCKDVDALKNLIADFKANLNNKTALEKAQDYALTHDEIEDEPVNSRAEGTNQKPSSNKDFTVDTAIIDFSKIEGYFGDGKISNKTFKDAKSETIEDLRELINGDSVQGQLKTQIKEKLEAAGYDETTVNVIFENAYNEAFYQVTNNDKLIQSSQESYYSIATCDVKDCVDEFITNFNQNISTAMTEMRKTNKDIDKEDIDISVIGEDNYESYKNGTTKSVSSKSTDPSREDAYDILETLRTQIEAKAKALCQNLGVDYDEEVFTTIFNNAKGNAAEASITLVRGQYSWQTNSDLNVKTLVDTFLDEFDKNYSSYMGKQ